MSDEQEHTGEGEQGGQTRKARSGCKICNTCDEEKPLGDFHLRGDDPKGRQRRSQCIECYREANRQRYDAKQAMRDPDEINPPGRPTRDTPYIRELLFQELSTGKLLRQVIRDNPEMPAYNTMMRWWLGYSGDGHDSFRLYFAQGKQAQIEAWLEQAWAELQDPRDDWVWHEKKQDYVPDKFTPQRLKELLQHTRWMAERVLPTLYGNRVQVEHQHKGNSQAAPQIDWSKLDAETIRKVRAAMIDSDAGGHEEAPKLVGESDSEKLSGEVIDQQKPEPPADDSG